MTQAGIIKKFSQADCRGKLRLYLLYMHGAYMYGASSSKRQSGNLSETSEQRWQHGNRVWLVSLSRRALSIDRCAPGTGAKIHQYINSLPPPPHQIVFFLWAYAARIEIFLTSSILMSQEKFLMDERMQKGVVQEFLNTSKIFSHQFSIICFSWVIEDMGTHFSNVRACQDSSFDSFLSY